MCSKQHAGKKKRQRGVRKPKPHALSFLNYKETLERSIKCKALFYFPTPPSPSFVSHLYCEGTDALSLHLLKSRKQVQVTVGQRRLLRGGLGRGQVQRKGHRPKGCGLNMPVPAMLCWKGTINQHHPPHPGSAAPWQTPLCLGGASAPQNQQQSSQRFIKQHSFPPLPRQPTQASCLPAGGIKGSLAASPQLCYLGRLALHCRKAPLGRAGGCTALVGMCSPREPGCPAASSPLQQPRAAPHLC